MKYLYFLALLSTLYHHNYIFADTGNIKNIASGRDRVFTIMYDGDHGIREYNTKITYAQTKNLVEDIYIRQIGKYFPTFTDLGSTYLFDTLSSVVSPHDTHHTVLHRQEAIKKIAHHSTLQAEIKDLLMQAQEHTDNVIRLMMNRDKVLEKIKIPDLSSYGMLRYILQPWYHLQNSIARNPWVNLGWESQKISTAIGYAMIAIAQGKLAGYKFINPNFRWTDPAKMALFYKSYGLIPNKGNVWTTEDASNFWTFSPYKLFHDTTKNKNYSLKDFLSGQIELSGIGGDAGLFTSKGREVGTLASGTLGMSVAAYNSLKSMYDTYQNGIEKRNLIHSLYHLVTIAEKLEHLCKHHKIPHQFKPSSITDKKGLAMLNQLKGPRYQETESSLVVTPWVHTFVTEIYEQDTYLAPFFALIAEIDTYYAIASKITETSTSTNTICFADILHEAKPRFAAQGLWNIIIKNPIANNISESRNIILTGPNAGGKSTLMRAIVQNLILSQTFGIATGTSFAVTPFDVINSYLNIKDNPLDGDSRLKAELKLATEIVTVAKTLRHDEKFFFIIDELFTSTGGKDGEICAYEFAHDDLEPYLHHIQFIFATHFEKLKIMEQSNPKFFANYKIDQPTRSDTGKFIYPFTISPGVSTINIAQQLKRDAGLLGSYKLGLNEPISIPENTKNQAVVPTQQKHLKL